ncbi:hypothetical protein DCS_06516 [Drechmeria coniospora]|uniref:Nascent polypeptide-associated complex subunit alpha-like UBA domain-containing protein n=1 Tax=Drechmeria coniospora TaxID=98403 RepID=A0A151GBR0_DRECN|nr:hypothetical protein DCS_06516 [Drechmeria coniospora]KYK54556.1 hypothetical protein DCS_06516 [Drechmeria coniospora]ODA80517.1 hypothetical protein RJ55_03476 [Drechmeria coniospora]
MASERTSAVAAKVANGDVEDESPTATKSSAEDRKAASALASLDANNDDSSAAKNIDQDAVNKAMKSLGSGTGSSSSTQAVAKNVKVDAADVALIVEQLELSKAKATELLKAHDGDAVRAMTAFVRA